MFCQMLDQKSLFQNAFFVRKNFLAPFLTISFLVAFQVEAQQFKVEKVKGNKAVIEYSGPPLSPGETYTVSGSGVGESPAGVGPRRYVVGGSFNLEFFTNSNTLSPGSEKDNSIGFLARFGWNKERYEFGLIAGYTNNETDTNTYSALLGGAFFDYNFTPNRPGEISIYGVGTETEYTTVTSSAGGTGMGIFASVYAKWFVCGPSTAIRVDVGYNYEKGNYTSYSTTTQGVEIRGGLATYF